jgi:hypothetical protein
VNAEDGRASHGAGCGATALLGFGLFAAFGWVVLGPTAVHIIATGLGVL